MIKKILFALLLSLLFISPTLAYEKHQKEDAIVIWNSAEGLKKLEQSQFKNDFYQLANFYQSQINPVYCSVASSVIVLNALNYGKIPSQEAGEINKPQNAGGGIIKFPLYLQSSFFNKKTETIKKHEIVEYQAMVKKSDGSEIYDPGVSLADLAKMLSKAYGLKVQLVRAEKFDEKSLKEFRNDLKEILADDKKFIIANFDGKIVGSKTGPHFSPLAAYDEKSDSLLVMDVALHQNPWFFTSAQKMFKAMNSKDKEEYRGYLIVSKK